ncbi:VOC family protein [Nocardioides marmorisolisilvae]|uniref:VOC family protein n=1 Tax=Nocardioides marmorisolisilvae TaxID=1542737 RepID=A0A3N0DXP6_9ACTN|nr:VOC family protein [Nocardioides marmorisolisilvae]RNL80380.1 VOC family protein [Nocardioides marmorisolisilvae]
MPPTWITAFLDFPTGSWENGVRFWRDVTASGLSPVRGADGEFATLLPATGEPFLRVQRTGADRPGIHLDLHGAEDHWEVRTSPGGFVFCVNVPAGGERPPPQAWPGRHTSLVDQVCLDIPPDAYDAECAYWADLTGWELAPTSAPYMRQLVRPAGMPLRILLQRRDEGSGPVTAHLDIATTDREAEVARHVALGAVVDGGGARWTRMLDPVGMVYCLTDRDPVTGLLP